MYREENARRNPNIQVGNKWSEMYGSAHIWEQLKHIKIIYMKKLKAVWTMDNACYLRSSIPLSTRQLSRNTIKN